MSAEQSTKINRIKDSKTKIEKESKQIQQRIIDFQNETKNFLEAFTTSYNQQKKTAFAEINGLLKSITSISSELDDYKKKTLVSEKDELNVRLEKLLGQITSGVEKLQKDMINLSTKQEEEISALYSEIADKISSGLENIYGTQRKQVSDFEKTIAQKLEEIQKNITTKVEQDKINHQSLVENITNSFQESLKNFHDQIQNLSFDKEVNIDQVFTGIVSDSITRLEGAKEDLIAAIDGFLGKLKNTTSNQKDKNQEMLKKITEELSKTNSEVMTKIKNQQQTSQESWHNLETNQIDSLNSVKETLSSQFQEALEVNESFQEKIITELEQKFKTSLYSEIDNISLSFAKYQDSILNQIDALISRLTSARDDMKNSLENLLISNLNKIGGIGKQLEEQFSISTAEISSEFGKSRKSTHTNLIKALNDRFSAISDSITTYNSSISDKLENTTSNIDISLKSFFDSTQNTLKDTVVKSNDSTDKLEKSAIDLFDSLRSGQEKNIETTLTDMKSTLRTKQSELIAILSGILPIAEEQIESNTNYLKKIKEEMLQKSSVGSDDLKEQIKLIENEGTTSIRSIVTETNNQLDSIVKSAENQSKKLVIGLEDQHKNAIVNFQTKSRQEIESQLSKLENYRKNLKEKFDKFFDDQYSMLEVFINENQIHKERINEQKRNIEEKLDTVNNEIEKAMHSLTDNVGSSTQNTSDQIKQVIGDINDLIKSI